MLDLGTACQQTRKIRIITYVMEPKITYDVKRWNAVRKTKKKTNVQRIGATFQRGGLRIQFFWYFYYPRFGARQYASSLV
jgi:hypothetical protein